MLGERVRAASPKATELTGSSNSVPMTAASCAPRGCETPATYFNALMYDQHSSRAVTVRAARHDPQEKSLGRVQAVYCRAVNDSKPRQLEQAEVVASHGMAGDRDASPHSPRQLLIAGDVAYSRFGLPEATLRENLRVDFSTEPLRSGDVLQVGLDVLLWLTFHCEPCGHLERRAPGAIKTIGKHRGMLARALRGGNIRVGDRISAWRNALPPFSEVWQARVLHVVRSIPAGHFITHRQLAEMAGVAKAYCRAFPTILATLPQEVAGRVARAGSRLPGPLWSGEGLFKAEDAFRGASYRDDRGASPTVSVSDAAGQGRLPKHRLG